MRLKSLKIALVVITALVALVAATGCTDLRMRSLSATEAESGSVRFEALDRAEREQLDAILEGEILTVYTSDTGLARVYGQVANFGEKRFEAVQFEIVADIKASSRSDQQGLVERSEVKEAVATFVIEGMSPGDIETFDVQTIVRPGDTRSLHVQVKGVR